MGGIFTCMNKGSHNAFAQSGATAGAPRPSDALTAPRVTNCLATGSRPLPLPSPRRHPSSPARPPQQNAPAQNAAGLASPATASEASRLANASLPVSQATRATQAKRASAIRALEIVAFQAEVTAEVMNRSVDTTHAQVQAEVDAINAHPPFVAHVAVVEALRTGMEQAVAAHQAYETAQAQAAARQMGILLRMAGAVRAANAGHPEQLQELDEETIAIQAPVNAARQAALAAVVELEASNAALTASVAIGDEMEAAIVALQPRMQALEELSDTKRLADAALVEARTAVLVAKGQL